MNRFRIGLAEILLFVAIGSCLAITAAPFILRAS